MRESSTSIEQCSNSIPDYIFIDDDKTLCKAWELKADFCNKTVLCFNSVQAFETVMTSIPRSTPIYIDSNLGNDEPGEFASKKLYDAGFHCIFLATGKHEMEIVKPAWIQAVVGKSPPF